MQRYKFESNSQLQEVDGMMQMCCVYLCKDTNLKAIHNPRTWHHSACKVVFTYAKIQIWKQFTTAECCTRVFSCCVYLCKDTNLKAIHNMRRCCECPSIVVFTYAKIQIWKQFTTTKRDWYDDVTLCLPMQRYKFESNSQRSCGCCSLSPVVFTYAKIQIWKQFTTYQSAMLPRL